MTDKVMAMDSGIRCVAEVRRMLKDAITAELVLNPAIDVLLALYLRRDDSEAMTRADVCAQTSVSEEVCRHWGLALAQRGLIAIEADRYRLSDEGRRTMHDINDEVWRLAALHLGARRPTS